MMGLREGMGFTISMKELIQVCTRKIYCWQMWKLASQRKSNKLPTTFLILSESKSILNSELNTVSQCEHFLIRSGLILVLI